MPGKHEKAQWVFDPLPASGARRGGDPASHVFRQTVTSFVREVVQNANDQRTGAPEIHFRFMELAGDPLAGFLAAVSWPTLEPHLRAAASTRGGRHLHGFLDDMDRKQRLLVLVVEDRHTVGLTGHELEGDSHFRALCKDTLFSHKQNERAGGSYGLGKSVLWTFSGLSMVLFNSNLSIDGPGQRSPRLFGRVELPTHEIARGAARRGRTAYSGSGWFGRRVSDGDGERAESVWAADATELAGALGLARSDVPGTSIAIVGFRDPAADTDRSAADLAKDIEEAVERDFWPAMVMPGNPLTVWMAATRPRPMLPARDLQLTRPFIEAYRGRTSTRTSRDTAGDVVVREIELEVPARLDGQPAVKGHVRLCVRLFAEDERESHPLAGHVAWFRGPGMIIWYADKRRLALGARPFHAVVACGDARAPEAPVEIDVAVERFLRAAEPPGHDTWESTAALKGDYKRGYAKALEQLRHRVDEALKEIVVAQPRRGRQGPERLRRMFPLGSKGGGGRGTSAFHVRDLVARFADGRWHFQGEVRPALELDQWECALRLSESGEDGAELSAVAIEQLETRTGAEVYLVDGAAVLVVRGPRLVFTGTSAVLSPAPGGRRAVMLEARSRVGAPP